MEDSANNGEDWAERHPFPSTQIKNWEPKTTETFPLSFNQRSIWLQHVLEPHNVANNISQAICLHNEVDLGTFERALQKTTERHPALRTTFTVQDNQPVQIVHGRQPIFFQCEDASNWDDKTVNKRLADETYRLFDLENGPLFRAFLFSRSANDHIFLLTMHHIITDMWSIAIFLNDLAAIYRNEISGETRPLPELKTSYFDHVTAQQNLLAGPEGSRLRAYWKKQLSGELPVLNLPTNWPRQAANTYQGAAHPLRLGPFLTSSLKELASTYKTTLFSVVLAAFQVLLHRYSGQDDILLGTPKAGRGLQTARLMGYFVNPVVLRANLSGNPPFAAFLQQSHQTVEDAFAHDAYPFQKLLEDFQLARDLNTSPFFQVAFAWQKSKGVGDRRVMASGAVGNAGIHTQFKGFVAEPMTLERPSPLDLTLLVGDVGSELVVTFEYKRDLFETDTIARMADHFQTLLAGIVAQPETPIAQLPLLTTADRQQMAAWNDTAVPLPPIRFFHQLFEQQVEQRPEATAVISGSQQLTYGELNQRANQLAHHLRSAGVGPEKFVGIFIDRSPEMIVALLGVLKAGGAYLPLDPDYPRQRLASMLADAQPDVILTSDDLRLTFEGANRQSKIVNLKSDWPAIAQHPAANLPIFPSPNHLAYVIYTSGSTGTPKGVMVPHRALVNYTLAAIDAFELTPGDRVLQFASFSFDTSAEEILPCLASGAALVLRTDSMIDDPSLFLQSCDNLGLTVVDLPTAYWHELTAVLVENQQPLPPSLRLVIIGGEAASAERVTIWQEAAGPHVRLLNTYGATETSIISTIYDLTDALLNASGRVPIGRPIPNVQTYILNEQQQPTPVGVPGELWIGGAGLACGYLNRPELTAERFIDLRLASDDNRQSSIVNRKFYRTGDLARYLPDGHIEYLGRADSQVKIRGFRVELGEIESALGQHPRVRMTAVTVHPENNGHNQLVAYLVPQEEPAPTTAELRQFLQQKLPHYMIPAAFVNLSEMPLSPNGKVDRKALPAPDALAPDLTKAYVAPQTPQEKLLATLWAQVLHVERVGIHDNFFELGGHSLLATQIVSRLRKTAQVDLPIRAIFEAPTIAELAGRVAGLQANGAPIVSRPLIPVERTGPLPLSFSQERMWFLYQLDPDSTAYNIPGAVRLKGPLDHAALEGSVNQIIARHESLRTRFTAVHGQPTAIIEPAYTYTLPVEDCRPLPESERLAYAIGLMEEAARTPFQLDQLPLIQFIHCHF